MKHARRRDRLEEASTNMTFKESRCPHAMTGYLEALVEWVDSTMAQ